MTETVGQTSTTNTGANAQTSGDVRPELARRNTSDCGTSNAELLGEVGVTFTSLNTAANIAHSILCQLGMAVLFALSLPLTFPHVLHVFAVGAQHQMSGVDAGRVITTVAHKQAVGNWTVGKFIRNAMCSHGTLAAILIH